MKNLALLHLAILGFISLQAYAGDAIEYDSVRETDFSLRFDPGTSMTIQDG